MDRGNQYQFQGVKPAPSTSQTGHIGQGQSVGRGRAQGLQAESSGQARQMTCYHYCQPGHMRRDSPRRQRSHGTASERADQSVMQGTFSYFHLLFDASCVKGLSLEVETSGKSHCIGKFSHRI